MGKGLCNVGDCGTTGFDVYDFVVGSCVWFGQLVEHLGNEIVEQDFGGMVQLHSDRD